jgi:hypothetical protein
MNALSDLTGAVKRQGAPVDRASGQPQVGPLLGQTDRVAALRALGLEQPGGLLLGAVVGPQDDRLVTGLGGRDQDLAPPGDGAVRVRA